MDTQKDINDINDILGYGKELKVLIGIKDDGITKDIRTLHFTPVSIEDIPHLMQKLNGFFNNTDFTKWTNENKEDAADIIFMSVKRMHPEITKEFVKIHFGLGIIAKAVKIVMDVNDFLSEVRAMNQTILEATKGLDLTLQKSWV